MGNFIDTVRFAWKSPPQFGEGFHYLETDFGKLRVFDSGGKRPVVVNVPDGPNVIEHQMPLIERLTNDYRVVCFEYPGLGFSYPNGRYNYSFDHGANLLLQVLDTLHLPKVSLLFSCSNGYYAIRAAMDHPERFQHLFLSQTPSVHGLLKWTEKSIPGVLKLPVAGQLVNAIYARKFAQVWYRYALPKNDPSQKDFAQAATRAMGHGGCFCLSSLVQGLTKYKHQPLNLSGTPTTLVWGAQDFSHRKTDKDSLKEHIGDCEVIEFKECGHFPELERTNEYAALIQERIG